MNYVCLFRLRFIVDPDVIPVSHRILRQFYWVFAVLVRHLKDWVSCCRYCFRPDASWLLTSHCWIQRMNVMTSPASLWNENKTMGAMKAIPPVILWICQWEKQEKPKDWAKGSEVCATHAAVAVVIHQRCRWLEVVEENTSVTLYGWLCLASMFVHE